MATTYARRRRIHGLGRKAAGGSGQFCVTVRKGRGKHSRTQTKCYKTSAAAQAAAHRGAGAHGGFSSVLFYKRKHKKSTYKAKRRRSRR